MRPRRPKRRHPGRAPPAPPVQRDTVAIDAPRRTTTPASVGCSRVPSPRSPARRTRPRGTSVFPPRVRRRAPRCSPPQPPAQSAPPPAQPPVAFWGHSAAATQPPVEEEQGPGRRAGLLIAGALVVVLLLGGVGWFVLGDRVSGDGGSAGGSSASDTPRRDRRSGPSRRSGAWATPSRRWTWTTAVPVMPTARSRTPSAVPTARGSRGRSTRPRWAVGRSSFRWSACRCPTRRRPAPAGTRRPERQRQRERPAARGRPVHGQPGGVVGSGVRQRPVRARRSRSWRPPRPRTLRSVPPSIDRVAGEALALEVPPFPGG